MRSLSIAECAAIGFKLGDIAEILIKNGFEARVGVSVGNPIYTTATIADVKRIFEL